MKNQQPINDTPEQPYFKGWFIALQNYEEYEIEAIKEKLNPPLLEDAGACYSLGTILSMNVN